MDKKIEKKCSTPVYGYKNIEFDLTLSEIRGGNVSARSSQIDSASGAKKKSEYRRGKNIKKKPQRKQIFTGDSDSDSEYTTVDVYEICRQELTENVNSRQNSVDKSPSKSNNSSPLCDHIFHSPSVNNFDNHAELYLNSPEINILPMLSGPSSGTINSPEFQKIFNDQTKFKTYSGPGIIKKNILSPSKISFSPKWVNRIATKYNSPSNIPSRQFTSIGSDENPESPGQSNRTFCYGIKRLRKDFTKHMIPSSKSYSVIRKKNLQSHLHVKSEQYKISRPTTGILAEFQKENVYKRRVVGTKTIQAKISKDAPKEYNFQNTNASSIRAQDDRDSKTVKTRPRNQSRDFQHSQLAGKREATTSLKYNSIDTAKELGKSFKQDSRSHVVTDRDSSEIRSPLPKISKPRVISIEIIKSPKIFKF